MRHPRHDPQAAPPTRVRLQLDDRCRSLARVLSLIEGRGLAVGELRFHPATSQRHFAEAVVEIHGNPALLDTLLARIEALPSVQRASLEAPLPA